jgi:hypothetical protein
MEGSQHRVHCGALGALLVFAGQSLYPANEAGAAAWGVTALGDQQMARRDNNVSNANLKTERGGV